MQDIILHALPIAIFAIAVGTIASMIGIGGGVLNTPLLIIVFGMPALLAPASSLVAALFVAVASSVAYYRQSPRPTQIKPGLFLAITTIPGSLTGVYLRGLIPDDYLLRIIFAALLFPIAIKMLFAKRKGKADMATEVSSFDFSQIGSRRLAFSLIGGFGGGVAAGLLGLGGGVIVVPVLCVLMSLPMHAAVATSMFTMIFTTSSGTIMNYLIGQIDLYYSLALGVGMIFGGQIGSRFASKVDAVRLKHIFGLIQVFPLVKMVKLGQLWLDPSGANFLLATLGDVIIWLAIVIPIGLFKLYISRIKPEESYLDE